MNTTYNSATPYAILCSGRPEDHESHKAIAVYSKAEYDTFRGKGWLTEREFTTRTRRAIENPKGDWHE